MRAQANRRRIAGIVAPNNLRLSALRSFGPVIAIPALAIISLTAALAGMKLGLSGTGAGLLAVTLFVVLGGAGVLAARTKAEPADPIHDDIRALAIRLDRIEERLARVETSSVEVVRRGLAPIAEEIGAVGALVRQMSEQIDMHEAVLQETLTANLQHEETAPAGWTHEQVMEVAQRPVAPAPRETFDPPANYPEALPAPPEPALSAPSVPAAEEAPPQADHADVTRLARALERGALDLHLEPVVALPQRRVVHYAALAFLRDERDMLISAAEVSALAGSAGLTPAVDTLVVDRAVRIAARLRARERPISLIARIADATLSNSAFTYDIARRLEAHPDIAPHVMLEFGQAGFLGLGRAERDIIAGLVLRGFRFSLSQITDFDMDAAQLAAYGIRHIRVPAQVLCAPETMAQSRVHPADLPGLFRRHGIGMIATEVASEPVVADLLDLDLRFASGPLFGQARPVRPEIFAADPATEAPQQQAPAVRPPEPRAGIRAIARSA